MNFSRAQCVGDMEADLLGGKAAIVRNTGGGTSHCCRKHPVAAGALIQGDLLQLPLEPREPGKSSRNGARVYVAELCKEGDYHATRFSALELLGRTLSVTVNLSAASCGCNAAFYTVSMAQNTASPGQCDGDYYCDANVVCGVRCAEIDLIEANQRAFHSTLHAEWDGNGIVAGIGGHARGIPNNGRSYGPMESATIDTRRPFRVHSNFAHHGEGIELRTTLTQHGGRRLSFSARKSGNYGRSLKAALQAGMTPVFSFWSDADISWLDGNVGCTDHQDSCGAEGVSFSELALCDEGQTTCDYAPRRPPGPPNAPPLTPPLPPSAPALPPRMPPQSPPFDPSPFSPPPRTPPVSPPASGALSIGLVPPRALTGGGIAVLTFIWAIYVVLRRASIDSTLPQQGSGVGVDVDRSGEPGSCAASTRQQPSSLRHAAAIKLQRLLRSRSRRRRYGRLQDG
jgi:hypothetical protein